MRFTVLLRQNVIFLLLRTLSREGILVVSPSDDASIYCILGSGGTNCDGRIKHTRLLIFAPIRIIHLFKQLRQKSVQAHCICFPVTLVWVYPSWVLHAAGPHLQINTAAIIP